MAHFSLCHRGCCLQILGLAGCITVISDVERSCAGPSALPQFPSSSKNFDCIIRYDQEDTSLIFHLFCFVLFSSNICFEILDRNSR